jgi:protein-L-isoaspartate(D-aspartate) O-methyltransferase
MAFENEKLRLLSNLQKQGLIKTEAVYNAMFHIPREKFLPPSVGSRAYLDRPLQIDEGQTISAPHMNAMMCEILKITPGDKILEIGTGSGYHAALLGYLTGTEGRVITIERHEKLAVQARNHLKQVGIQNVEVIIGDGTKGYEKFAPYDKILVTAASPTTPPPLMDQVSQNGGIICIPLGNKHSVQALFKIIRKGEKFKKTKITGVMFVPLIGKFGFS